VKRILLVLSVAALMAAMLAATAGTALAKVQRGPCVEGIGCRQGILLPDQPKSGQTFEGEGGFVGGQASMACPAILRTPLPNPSEQATVAFFHCFESPDVPIVLPD
jgi:hypothetical protein